MNEHPDKGVWEDQINALLDGELDEAQTNLLRATAESDPTLNQLINEAFELRQLMSEISHEKAPVSLHGKLRRIPRQESVQERTTFFPLFQNQEVACKTPGFFVD